MRIFYAGGTGPRGGRGGDGGVGGTGGAGGLAEGGGLYNAGGLTTTGNLAATANAIVGGNGGSGGSGASGGDGGDGGIGVPAKHNFLCSFSPAGPGGDAGNGGPGGVGGAGGAQGESNGAGIFNLGAMTLGGDTTIDANVHAASGTGGTGGTSGLGGNPGTPGPGGARATAWPCSAEPRGRDGRAGFSPAQPEDGEEGVRGAKHGGGVYSDAVDLITLTDVTFHDNTAGQGGGMYAGGDLRVADVTFQGNTAEQGGGMYAEETIRVANVTFRDNHAVDGGGVYLEAADATLVNVAFVRNLASANGGGMYNQMGHPTSSLANVVFSHNQANSNGGALFNTNSDLALVNVTMSNNEAGAGENQNGLGGGIFHEEGSCSLKNSILWQNTGSEIGQNDVYPIDEFIIDDNSLLTDDWIGRDDDPQFVDSENDDLRLQGTSYAIDKGNSADLPQDVLDLDGDGVIDELLPLDLEGNARIYGNSVDLGAHEVPCYEYGMGQGELGLAYGRAYRTDFQTGVTIGETITAYDDVTGFLEQAAEHFANAYFCAGRRGKRCRSPRAIGRGLGDRDRRDPVGE